jgi:prophage regulatory protein
MRYLRWPEVRQRTGLSRSTIWRLELEGGFPRRVQLSPGTIGWAEADVEDWLRDRHQLQVGSFGLNAQRSQ